MATPGSSQNAFAALNAVFKYSKKGKYFFLPVFIRFWPFLTVAGVPNIGHGVDFQLQKDLLTFEFVRQIKLRAGRTIRQPVIRAQYRKTILIYCAGDVQYIFCRNCAANYSKFVR